MHVKLEERSPMSDLIDNALAPEATAETDTAQVDSQQPEQTTETPTAPVAEKAADAQTAAERMVPISTVQKERKERQELQRKLAEYEQKSKLSQYDENDMQAVMNHPYVQELLIKQAKSELTEFAKGILDEHSEIPDAVKKAITANVRGFVKETTTDVDTAKIDIQEYIDNLVEQMPVQAQQPKNFPVAAPKAQDESSGTNPLEVQQVLEKPVDEWSDDEAKLVAQYKKTMPKR